MTYYIKADKFFYPYEVKTGGFLQITDGKFGKWMAEAPASAEILDYSGQSIAPGLVDTHIHGFGGADTNDRKIEGIVQTMSEGLLAAGVTSFFPTAVTASHEELLEVADEIGSNVDKAAGAKIRGLFFEGPYFTEEFKGAQNPKYMRDPSYSELAEYGEAAKGLPIKIGIAPEREGSTAFVKEAVEHGFTIALGHSNATYADAVAAVQAGATMWVHAFNGMRGLNHREPGMVGAVFNLPNTYAELICDGFHVRPEACQILMREKGTDHVVLITDSMRAAGLSDGEYYLGEFPVIVKEGAARLKEGGNLAGSILLLKDAVKNVVDWQIATPAEAVKMASLNAAKSTKIDDVCGQIKEGLDADFIVLDEHLELVATYLDGEKRYQA
ncbi:N-acetylglucosamine-6-phosphate deacetylase [Lactococcus garvieae]|uniref:N-acetylglucosamine-6-phosphate deacetylase n=1 Tax=Lactococcus garvieae TaxID=1363 RepID=A0AAX3NHL3_9LACT|nr:N-acetylglucosamine-6-phosphate deacetylase [Lactococcus garvieae]KAA8712230.1 N-acetylglucosamine-6-phosphate deacetylase [Lactococcus garvieae subsp. garvieae]MDG6191690.1 N-acetylglucosamine-6-phosphate deacetylase [Lactococcus garvieae]NHI68935.1 N-acetylglucosamine-6-phosphate deacetylase [Lactococcus garvieae]NHJ07493.1 N-acetylglucosamine-6-phosphate deacetylase [Lactococcus garvieae]PCS02210.1 N-acetylglucosamine-6-phosphate deacetylase [Lactococcus garvieae]